MVTIKAGALADFVRDIFIKAGCSAAEGERIGKYLVGANLAGHDSHGVVRVPRYLQWKQEGAVVADQKVEIKTETPVLAVVDGVHGFGQTVAPQAVQIGIDKCKAMGLSMVALRNAGHIGRVGDWAEMAAAAGPRLHPFRERLGQRAGCPRLAAPSGACRRRRSAPASRARARPRSCSTFATSVVAEGKVLVASLGGKKLPDNALIALDGKMSTDPRLLYGEYTPTGPRLHTAGPGAIRAFGDHKGSGLAPDVRATRRLADRHVRHRRGANASATACCRSTSIRRWWTLSPCFPPMSPATSPTSKSAKPATAGGEVLTPGEPEERTRRQRLAEGVPLPDDTWASIVNAAREAGVDERRIQQVGGELMLIALSPYFMGRGLG
jgi:uncharacterized oxidoreductase